MRFDPLRFVDRYRHYQEQLRANEVLPDVLPRLEEITDRANQHECRLQPIYERYVAEISSPDMAMSLPLAAFLWGLCEHAQPRKILDLGSGFSSFVFRSYAQQADGTLVTSVDDSPEWLQRTREFLKDQQLSGERLYTWDAFRDTDEGDFDLVFHDLGSMQTRAEALPEVLNRTTDGGLLILDDVHKRGYERIVKRVLRQRDMHAYSLRSHTLDGYGRFSSLALVS